MMSTVRGTHRSGGVEVLGQPKAMGPVEIVLTVLGTERRSCDVADFAELPPEASITPNAPPVGNFDHSAPAKLPHLARSRA